MAGVPAPRSSSVLGGGVPDGDSLTDLTYWDWIDIKGKRIFLILADLGVASLIFDLIDDSWCDEDLPISPEGLERIQSLGGREEKTSRRFYQRQFAYLLRPLRKGDLIVYSDHEMVPVEIMDRKPVLAASSSVDKVTLPNESGSVFWRRRVPIGDSRHGDVPLTDFYSMIDSVSSTDNEHIVSYWASYIHRGSGYILFGPASDISLKMFLATQPACYKNLEKKDRKRMVMDWIMCLADTVSYLHSKNKTHRYIKPSTVLFSKNHIILAHPSRLSPEPLTTHTDKNSFDREWYDYAAPEQWFRPTGGHSGPSSSGRLSCSPPENKMAISILRHEYSSHKPHAMLSTPNPHLNPKAADIFSLGCIILELLSFLLKKQHKFAAFRAARHKTPGRGGAVLDSSFHRNLGQVEAWMSTLAKEASKKGADGYGATPLLHLVARMLSASPNDRPPADEVAQAIYEIITEHCGFTEPHCVHRYETDFDYEVGMQHLRINDRGARPDSMTVATEMAFSQQDFAYDRGSSMGMPGNSWGSSASTDSTHDGISGRGSVRGSVRTPVRTPMRTSVQDVQVRAPLQNLQVMPPIYGGHGTSYF
ncbi:uncharacterized protein DNG_06137 [Cephalotrichum gorgonifer]|uniref:Protein kinase domain-containing protein n=1 Tax=Cephalotrichum gorgonifer TaxID=2041049 RepID=A0AAE8N0X6_9PEZI|nr:uncharacterized protein DNG_06137 [Cephalotrichum gorgonifer]